METLSPEPNTVFVKEMWVDDQDVWISTGVQPFQNNDSIYEQGVLRLTRASLGQPNVPPQ